MFVFVVLACVRSPPGPPPPEVDFVAPPRSSDGGTWDGRHDLLVLPAQGEPIEVPRQWQLPMPGVAVRSLRYPLLNVPTIAIDAQRPWQQVCPHLRRWRARGEAPLVPPPHLKSSPPSDGGAPPPPPPPVAGPPCEPVALARGPATWSAPEAFTDYPVMNRQMDRLCTGAGREGVPFEVVIAEGSLTMHTSKGEIADLDDLHRRLRVSRHKDVRITSIAPQTPWVQVQQAVDGLRGAGAMVWLPLDCSLPD